MNNQFQYQSQETIEYVVELFKSGNDERAIRDHTGLSFWTVAEILDKVLNHKVTI
jgi:hypothetical protein